MKLRSTLTGSWQAVAGVSLALILQTNTRFTDGLGLGEIGLAACAGVALLWAVMDRGGRRQTGLPFLFAKLLAIYLILLLIPLTLIHSYFGTPGSSVRDLFAYGLSFASILAIAATGIKVDIVAKWLIGACMLLVTYQYFYGGSNAWYSTRFTGGAKNPNQLALYIVCCVMLALIFVRHRVMSWGSVGLLLFFGWMTKSDALFAYLVATSGVLLATFLVPRRYFIPLLVPMLLGLLIVLALIWPILTEWMFDEWQVADEGGARTALYLNGLSAWMSNIGSIIIGHGGGSFSGIGGPFQGAEAHSTPIDLLTIGGLVGLLVLYVVPLRGAVRLYENHQNLIFAAYVGLLCFTLFHFVARHPVWWFSIYAALSFAFKPSDRAKGGA